MKEQGLGRCLSLPRCKSCTFFEPQPFQRIKSLNGGAPNSVLLLSLQAITKGLRFKMPMFIQPVIQLTGVFTGRKLTGGRPFWFHVDLQKGNHLNADPNGNVQGLPHKPKRRGALSVRLCLSLWAMQSLDQSLDAAQARLCPHSLGDQAPTAKNKSCGSVFLLMISLCLMVRGKYQAIILGGSAPSSELQTSMFSRRLQCQCSDLKPWCSTLRLRPEIVLRVVILRMDLCPCPAGEAKPRGPHLDLIRM